MPPSTRVWRGWLYFPRGYMSVTNVCSTSFRNTMAELLEEIVARDDAAGEQPDAQERFHALAFPAKHGAQVIKQLTAVFGSLADMGYAHLKRMKKHDVTPQQLIALVVPVAAEGHASAASDEQLLALQSDFDGSLCEVEVLKRGPKTRELWEEHTKSWPLIFHASVAPETLLEPITVNEAKQMTQLLKEAVACGVQFRSEHAEEAQGFCCATGCVIADPTGSSDGTSYTAVADSFTHHSEPQYVFRTIFHPVMVALDGVAARDRGRGDGGPSKKHRRVETTDDTRAPADAGGRDATAETESYLCTGYDVFVDVEPCVMCAMALIHSRARRVVFATRNETDGALTSTHRLHTIKSLNHHYRAFHLRLKPQEQSTAT